MYELKKNGKVFTSKFVGTGPSSYEKRIYRAVVSQRLRNTGVAQWYERNFGSPPANILTHSHVTLVEEMKIFYELSILPIYNAVKTGRPYIGITILETCCFRLQGSLGLAPFHGSLVETLFL